MDNLFPLILFGVLLVTGFVFGSNTERRHYASIREREKQLGDILLVPGKQPPERLGDCRIAFVCGSAVIGMDYFKMTLAAFVNFLGGRIGAYETLVERARREAILRMKEDARHEKGRYICNIKFSTANVMGQQAKQAGCVEVIAYGTAIVPHDS